MAYNTAAPPLSPVSPDCFQTSFLLKRSSVQWLRFRKLNETVLTIVYRTIGNSCIKKPFLYFDKFPFPLTQEQMRRPYQSLMKLTQLLCFSYFIYFELSFA